MTASVSRFAINTQLNRSLLAVIPISSGYSVFRSAVGRVILQYTRILPLVTIHKRIPFERNKGTTLMNILYMSYRVMIVYFIKVTIIQGGFYVCWSVHGPALHEDRCSTCCEAHTNFANESECLMTDNVQNEGKFLSLFTDHRRCWKLLSLYT
jgi:hypothetical protein